MRTRGRALVAVSILFLALAGWDLSRAPARQLSSRALLFAIDGYQATLSKAMPRMGVSCRFQPTCSVYGEMVIRRYGALGGVGRALQRIARCGPWTPAGTVDPPPAP